MSLLRQLRRNCAETFWRNGRKQGRWAARYCAATNFLIGGGAIKTGCQVAHLDGEKTPIAPLLRRAFLKEE